MARKAELPPRRVAGIPSAAGDPNSADDAGPHGTPTREAQIEIEDRHCPRRECWPAGGGCWLFDRQRCPFPVMTAQQQSGPYSLPPTHSALFRSPLLYVLEEAKVSVKVLVRPVG